MIPIDSQNLESYVPVYDVIPDTWDLAKPFFVEQLKRLANAVNIREIGWFLDQELLTGKAFIPGINNASNGATSQSSRTILRIVVEFPGLAPGVNTQPHGITVDANFSLIQMYGGATNANALIGQPIPNGVMTVSYNANNIIVTSNANYTRAWVVMEYIQEL